MAKKLFCTDNKTVILTVKVIPVSITDHSNTRTRNTKTMWTI